MCIWECVFWDSVHCGKSFHTCHKSCSIWAFQFCSLSCDWASPETLLPCRTFGTVFCCGFFDELLEPHDSWLPCHRCHRSTGVCLPDRILDLPSFQSYPGSIRNADVIHFLGKSCRLVGVSSLWESPAYWPQNKLIQKENPRVSPNSWGLQFEKKAGNFERVTTRLKIFARWIL